MTKSIVPFKVYKALALLGNGTVNSETLAAGKTLLRSDAQFQLLDAGGAGRDVTLPAEELSDGLFFVISNKSDAAESLTIKIDAGTSISTVDQNEIGVYLCDGSSWHIVGVFSGAIS